MHKHLNNITQAYLIEDLLGRFYMAHVYYIQSSYPYTRYINDCEHTYRTYLVRAVSD